MATTLTLPVEGSDRVVIKKTFIEVEDDHTPTGLPATYNSDSVIWSRFMRQISPQEDQGPTEPVVPEPVTENPLLSSLNKKERRSRSSVSTVDDTDTETCERDAEIREVGQCLPLARLREPSPEALDAAMALAMTQASKALEAAGITMERLPLDELLTQISSEPRPVSLLEAVGDVGPGISGKKGDTTVMLRNLPNNYSRNMVCTMMDKEGFHGKYDFLYLPIDFRSKASLGYAFVNLINEVEAQNFWKTFDGYTKWVLPSAKVCSVSWSGPHQGQKSHVQRYRDSPIMHGSVPDEFKPVIFEAGTGKRLDFPPPSKKLRAPRRRPATLK
mmetsp:Transcript_15626/g.19123  ORF Transcript_15626/g.19123 Transcript_15626/m.19123 type:complete len:330 (+) Transcript_15626:66-1055(+)